MIALRESGLSPYHPDFDCVVELACGCLCDYGGFGVWAISFLSRSCQAGHRLHERIVGQDEQDLDDWAVAWLRAKADWMEQREQRRIEWEKEGWL